MKKLSTKLSLILLVMSLFFLLNHSSYAQAPNPCTPDCEDTAWVNNNITVNLRGCNPNCYVKIYYSYRIACGVFQDVQIRKVETLTNYCINCSIKDLYMQSLYAVITINPMNFVPHVGDSGCSTIWRVSAGGCLASWQIYYHDPTHEGDTLTIIQKCLGPNVPCCLAYMKVCRYPRPGFIPPKPDSVTISTLSNSYPAYNCNGTIIPHVDTLPPPPDTTICRPICDWFNDVVYITPKIAQFSDVLNNDFSEQKSIILYPNPAESVFKFDLNSPDAGNVNIRIYDSKQNLVQSEERFVINGWNNLQIPVNQLASGNYNIMISINGIVVHSKKLQIIK